MKEPDNDNGIDGLASEQYGDQYRDHLLGIYKDFVTSSDKVSARRLSASQVFLAINSSIIGLLGYFEIASSNGLKTAAPLALCIVGVLGIVVCMAWYLLLDTYRQLNDAKFQVIHELEEYLPVKVYKREWSILENIEYASLASFEKWVPGVFILGHCFFIVYGVHQFLHPCST